MITPKFQHSPHFQQFWQQGNGHELLVQAQVQPNAEIFSRYSPLYHSVDELGDEVVRQTYHRMPFKEAEKLISSALQNPTAETPEALTTMLQQMRALPQWYQPELAKAGARLCMRAGTNALIILRDFSLMGGYDFANLAKPLVMTGALKKGAVKRLKDTLEFWVHVTREDAQQNPRTFELLVRTRLMHSYARLEIRKRLPDWNYEAWGEPINLWDMIATYTGFSLVFMQGLKKLGLHISATEEKGLFHLWKHIGYQLGIPAAFIPEDRQTATQQFYWWATLQDHADADAAQLARALLDENMENTIYKYRFQRSMLRNLHQSMNWFLLDPEVNRRLEIPKPAAPFRVFPRLIKAANRVSQKVYALDNPVKYEKLVQIGNEQQMNVLADYLEHTPA